MALKGLVKFFTIAMILVSVFQLSITWFVKQKDKEIEARVEKQMKAFSKDKYNKDALDSIKVELEIKEEAKAADEPTAYGMSYKKSKGSQLQLGLDLQGGMSVTLEIATEGLIRNLTNNSKDPILNKALDNALTKKANTGANFISLFVKEFESLNPTGKLAGFFIGNSNGKLTLESSNSAVASFLQDKELEAFDSNIKVINKRIDNFGLVQPGIYPDRENRTISVEMAGVKNPENIKKDLQNSANLQMWEVAPYGLAKAALDKGAASWAMIDTLNPNGSKKKTLATMLKNPTSVNMIGVIDEEDKAFFDEMLKSDAFKADFGNTYKILYGINDGSLNMKKSQLPVYAINTYGNDEPEIGGKMITNSNYNADQFGKAYVTLDLNQDGKTKFGDMTRKLAGNGAIAIVLDNIVYSAPNVNEKIEGGNASISGGFQSITEAKELSDVLNSGKLSAPIRIVQDNIVGPTLGEKSIKGGLLSFGISFLVIFFLMLVYYNTSGWIANLALIANLLFTLGALSMFGFTLTAPGIAGLVLTIGMAVDTNVIIFERIKEELEKGKSYAAAVAEGYRRSMAPVLDAHFTTFLTAAILFYFGLGPIKGFATTQMLGITLSLFCGILVSRLITEWFSSRNKEIKYFTPLSRKIFKHAQYKFIEFRKYTYMISLVVLALGIAAIFNGFDTGVEYAGGRSYTVVLDKNVKNTDDLRKQLSTTFQNKSTVVKSINGSDKMFDITTSYLIDAVGDRIKLDSTVRYALYNGVKPYLEASTTEPSFARGENKKGIIASKKVEPSISNELKKGAQKAAIISILIIALYIFIRFRDWRYSLGTIVALLHDVFVTLAVFSFLKHVMPFPLELDQHFIAAVLTVIGFSMNDTIIVFDRVRENAKKMKGETKEKIINTSINETLSRTIMTSLTVFLTILILFIFGGDVTRGFAFAMLIGVIVGTYSSIFVAAPMLVDFAKNTPLGKADFVDHTNETTSAAEKAIR